MREQQFGGPTDRTKPYLAEIYCAMCNRVPVEDTWDRSSGKIIGAYIGQLWAVPMTKGMGPEAKEVDLMVCSGCLARIDAKMRKEINDRKRDGKWPFGPDDMMGGGGIGVRPMG